MINLQFEILEILKKSNGMKYSEIAFSLFQDPNDVHSVILALLDDKCISSSVGLGKNRRGFITLTEKGVITYYAELEHREFMLAQNKQLREQFKVTQRIAIVSTVAVAVQALITIAQFLKPFL